MKYDKFEIFFKNPIYYVWGIIILDHTLFRQY